MINIFVYSLKTKSGQSPAFSLNQLNPSSAPHQLHRYSVQSQAYFVDFDYPVPVGIADIARVGGDTVTHAVKKYSQGGLAGLLKGRSARSSAKLQTPMRAQAASSLRC
jgi:hypothetical protein